MALQPHTSAKAPTTDSKQIQNNDAVGAANAQGAPPEPPAAENVSTTMPPVPAETHIIRAQEELAQNDQMSLEKLANSTFRFAEVYTWYNCPSREYPDRVFGHHLIVNMYVQDHAGEYYRLRLTKSHHDTWNAYNNNLLASFEDLQTYIRNARGDGLGLILEEHTARDGGRVEEAIPFTKDSPSESSGWIVRPAERRWIYHCQSTLSHLIETGKPLHEKPGGWYQALQQEQKRFESSIDSRQQWPSKTFSVASIANDTQHSLSVENIIDSIFLNASCRTLARDILGNPNCISIDDDGQLRLSINGYVFEEGSMYVTVVGGRAVALPFKPSRDNTRRNLFFEEENGADSHYRRPALCMGKVKIGRYTCPVYLSPKGKLHAISTLPRYEQVSELSLDVRRDPNQDSGQRKLLWAQGKSGNFDRTFTGIRKFLFG